MFESLMANGVPSALGGHGADGWWKGAGHGQLKLEEADPSVSENQAVPSASLWVWV